MTMEPIYEYVHHPTFGPVVIIDTGAAKASDILPASEWIKREENKEKLGEVDRRIFSQWVDDGCPTFSVKPHPVDCSSLSKYKADKCLPTPYQAFMVSHGGDAIFFKRAFAVREDRNDFCEIISAEPFGRPNEIAAIYGHIAPTYSGDVLAKVMVSLADGRRSGYKKKKGTHPVSGRPVPINHWVLGKGAKLRGGSFRPWANLFTESGIREYAEQSRRIRHMCRGHWRMQRCGPGRMEVKRVWVKSHWKGVANDTAATRNYEVTA